MNSTSIMSIIYHIKNTPNYIQLKSSIQYNNKKNPREVKKEKV